MKNAELVRLTETIRVACSESRGTRALFRKAWSSDKTPVLPYLASRGVPIDSHNTRQMDVTLLVAGAIGFDLPHKEGVSVGKMLRELFFLTKREDPSPEDQSGSIQATMRKLTAKEYDILSILRPVLMRCKNEGIGLDHGRLLTDLWFWDDRKARGWIKDFYTRPQVTDEDCLEGECGSDEECDSEGEV